MTGKILALAYCYLRAHLLRTSYLVCALIVAFIGYALLAALTSPFLTPKVQKDNGISITAAYGLLPTRYAKPILHMPGIEAVAYGTVLAIPCREGVTASLNGIGTRGTSVLKLLGIEHLAPTQAQKWLKDWRGLLVGRALAKRCGWNKGVLLQLKTPEGQEFSVQIDGLYHNGKQPLLDQVAIAHYRYLDSLQPKAQQGTVMWMSAKAADPREAQRLAVTIDAHFSRSSPPTKSSVNATSQGALAQYGNVLRIVEFVMAAVFACALLVTVNVAAYAAAERRTQFALLRVLGFSRRWIVLLAAMELLYVATVGCGLGLAVGLALLHWVIKPLLGSVFAGLFTVPASALYLAPAIAAGIVVISTLIPAWEIFRLRTARLTAP